MNIEPTCAESTDVENTEVAALNVETLNVESVPLNGVRLIEASAGTGKTYTITSLYVRLVLGHECTPLSPEKILVVTFTRAATEELRDRIRKRLKQALTALQTDITLDSVIEKIAPHITDMSQAQQRLKDAIQIMDMAAIYTIHGFAQRLLRQNSMESSVADDFELSLDEASFIQQAVRDVWRTHVYPKQNKQLTLLLQSWKTPDDLQKSLMPLLHKEVDFHLGAPAGNYEAASDAFDVCHQALSKVWLSEGKQFINSIRENPKASGSFTRWLEGRELLINQFVDNPQSVNSKDAKAFSYFTVEGLKKSVKKGGFPSDHILSDLFTQWWDNFQLLEECQNYASFELLIFMLEKVRIRLKQLKDAQSILAPDDLLAMLNRAIEGETGSQLLQQIRDQYPVAMVDEFQDTDAMQYRVFNSLYQAKESQKQRSQPQEMPTDKNQLAMFMIGDPKQAIYKFRGADIFTYINAKKAVDGAYSLDTNYRSTHNMVAAVNGFFTRHDRPFIYDADIPFVPVKAKGDAATLNIAGQPSTALSWVFCDGLGKTSKVDISDECSEGTAEQICQLLNLAKSGGAVLSKGGDTQESSSTPLSSTPLLAKDIAVLVRSAKQAKWIKNALSKRGIGSVYVGRESIFQSDQAMAMHSLLQAIHMLSERQFRNAIAHPIWCVSLQTLQQFMDSESLWEEQLEQLYQAREVWQKKGVMAMFMYWLHKRDLPATWLDRSSQEQSSDNNSNDNTLGENEDGERCLTNYLHLAEILQDASTQVQGMQGLISWLSHKISVNLGQDDQQMLRLESDANLVQIVTIHKSKGLEYPVVFLPFSWDGKESSDPLFYDVEKQALRCDLVGDFKDQRITEGLAEEVRLLYVALTRASAKCFVALPKGVDNKKLIKTLKSSALYHVLAQGEVETLTATLVDEANATDVSAGIYEVLSMPQGQGYLTQVASESDLSVQEFNGQLKQDWMMSSFSSLIRHVHVPMSARLNQDEDNAESIEGKVETPLEECQEDAELAGAFAFPRGAHAGNFLHTLLEEIDFSCLPDDLDQLITDLLTRFSIETHWLDVVKEWLSDILGAPFIHQQGLALKDLTPAKKLVEMEFYFPVNKLNSGAFNKLLNQYPCLQVAVKPTDFRQLKGMLKGFVDLIFEWGGQYFILDYKSNFLGEQYDDYHQLATHQAMSDHRYDVQLVIYTLALHRLLKLRIATYDYDQHIGGGYYMFLRGMNAADSQHHYGQYFHKPEKALIEALDKMISEDVPVEMAAGITAEMEVRGQGHE